MWAWLKRPTLVFCHFKAIHATRDAIFFWWVTFRNAYFYGRSGDFWVSAPYLLLIVVIILANELIQKVRPPAVQPQCLFHRHLFLLSLSDSSFDRGYGTDYFIGSGLLALVVMHLLLKALGKIIPHFMMLEKNDCFSIASLYVLFNTFTS